MVKTQTQTQTKKKKAKTMQSIAGPDRPDDGRRAVRGSRSGRPIMVLLDLLGQRWSLRILWELRDGAATFRALRTRCDEISPTMLSRRLAALREAGLVTHADGTGYALTAAGSDLGLQLVALSRWADTWAAECLPAGD